VRRYDGAQHYIIQGGDHGFGDFAQHLEVVFQFGRL
jgi:predicted esterase YcpF (UPF0227 family)